MVVFDGPSPNRLWRCAFAGNDFRGLAFDRHQRDDIAACCLTPLTTLGRKGRVVTQAVDR